MKKFSLFLTICMALLLLLYSFQLSAQNAKLCGIVSYYIDSDTNTIAQDESKLRISHENGLSKATIGEDGFFEFEDIPVGIADMSVTKPGQWPFEEVLELKEGDNFCFLFVTDLSRVGEPHKPIRYENMTLFDTTRRFYPIEVKSTDKGWIEIQSSMFLPVSYLKIYSKPDWGSSDRSYDFDWLTLPNKAMDKLLTYDGVELDGKTLRLDPSRFHVTAYEKGVLISCMNKD